MTEMTYDELFMLPRRDVRAELGEAYVRMCSENTWIKNAYDPPFTASSARLCPNREELRAWLEFGNWSNGSAFAIESPVQEEEDGRAVTLCFVQQGDATDEWLCIKSWPREGGTWEHVAFESISWYHILTRGGGPEYEDLLSRLLAASPEQCRTYSY